MFTKLLLTILLSINWSRSVAQTDRQYIDSLLRVLSVVKEDSEKVKVLLDLAGFYERVKADSVLILGQQALVLSVKLHDAGHEAQSKTRIGAALWLNGNYLEADSYLQEALHYAILQRDSIYLFSLYAMISGNKRDKGDYRDALYYCFRGDSLGNSAGLFKMIAASVYVEMNVPDSALYYLRQGGEDLLAAPWRGYALWVYGRAYAEKGDHKQAYLYYHQSLSKPLVTKDLSDIYRSLAQLFTKEGNTDSFVYYAKKGYETARDGNYAKGVWQTALLLSSEYEKSDPSTALEYYKLGMAAKDRLFDLQKASQFLNRQFTEQLRRRKEEADKIEYHDKIRTYRLVAALVAFLLIALIILRNISLKRKNESHLRAIAENELQLQKLESERTRAELQQQATELEMQALRAQMNPHFIFNCLSSINHFILKNESEIASEYLTKFSRLIRMVLNNSKNSLINLDDELEMLRLYLDLENLRFNYSFDYSINFYNYFDISSIFIPPLLLQPFAENAIWHGLMNKKEKGILEVAFQLDDDALNCYITDNGVGRKNAERLKSKSAEKQKSMGMEITAERLALFNNDTGKTIFDIEDLVDAEGQPAGTRVTLKIRYKNRMEEFS